MPNLEACKTCKIGSCCYEGTELSIAEVKRIIKFDPSVPKPWFRRLDKKERTRKDHIFTTILRNDTCVFHDKSNRCLVYPVRPESCRDFPLEQGRPAQYYERLCVLFHEEWAHNSFRKRTLKERDGENPSSGISSHPTHSGST